MTFLNFQKAWATKPCPVQLRGQPGQLQDSGLFWWHPKTISEHFEPLCWVFFLFPNLHLLHCFCFFFLFVLEITKRYLLAKKLVLLRPRNEKNRTDGHREPEGSVGPSLASASSPSFWTAKGSPRWEGAGGGWSEPLTPGCPA